MAFFLQITQKQLANPRTIKRKKIKNLECTFESPKGILLTSSYYTLEWGRKAIWCDCQQLHFIRRPLLYVHLLKDGITFLSYIIVFFQMFTSLRKYFCHVTIILPCSLFLINEYNIAQIPNKVYSDWYKIIAKYFNLAFF